MAEGLGASGGRETREQGGDGGNAEASAYTITEALHSSGRAIIYRGARRVDGRQVILKVLTPHYRPAHLERLQNEYEVASLFDVPTVVHPVALDTYQGRPALILDDFGGASLREQLGAPMEIGQFLRLALAITDGVADIHARNFVHKDLKPDNILLNPFTGQVKIADFGIAAPVLGQRQSLGSVRQIEGSLPYISPEQTGHTNRALDQRSDLYSLGVAFFEMLTGRLPFHAADPVDWVHCHVASRPPAPVSLVASIPAPLSEMVLKLLSKDADDRYQSARGLRHDLQRCYLDWTTKGRIEPFAPGLRDVSDRFQIPQKLYGREQETAALLGHFERVLVTGTPALALVSGYSGMGKSALVHELQKAVVSRRGLFAEGKFDQYKRDIPYSTIVQACADLVLEILAESEARIGDWRARLLAALGGNGQLIIDVIPQVELVIGSQPPVPALPPAESQNRFRFVFRRFVGVFAQAQHPLALFLDDLQWADSASLALLKELVTQSVTCHLLVVGAYRDNEVGASHPLTVTLDQIGQAGGRIDELALGPLSARHLSAFVGDVLHCPRAEVEPLANLIEAKTGGNPLFTIQFLTALHDEHLVEFDAAAARWRWDMAKIQAKRFTDNVVDLMVRKLARLSRTSQDAVKILACLGTGADVATVRMVLDRTGAEHAYHSVFEAVRAGLLTRTGDSFRFIHDRVQEAAYSQIPAAERGALHLRIGRLLVQEMSPAQIEERVFDVVNQLNRGVDLIADAQERAVVYRLNLLAGNRAKAAVAHASAGEYLRRAVAFQPDDAWGQHYDEVFKLYLGLAECEYLLGNFAAADQLFAPLLARARSSTDRMRVTRLQIRLYQMTGRFAEALALGIAAFASLGITCPADEEALRAEFAAEAAVVKRHLARRSIADLVDAPLTMNPEVRAAVGLLVDHYSCAINAGSRTLPLTVIKVLNLCLHHGNTEEAGFAYVASAVIVASLLGDHAAGYQLSAMGLQLNERFDEVKLRGCSLTAHLACIYFWREPFSTHPPLVERALEACLQVGDFLWIGNLGGQAVWQSIESGVSLDEVLATSQRFAGVFRQTHNDLVGHLLTQFDHFVANLRGNTRDRGSFSDADFDEDVALGLFSKAGALAGLFVHHLLKEISNFVWGRPREALLSAARATEYQGASLGTVLAVTHEFYHALILAGACAAAGPEERDELVQRLPAKVEILRGWAEQCPENFHNRHALVAAELAQLQGRDIEAMRRYDEAIASAAAQGFTHHEAMANELAAAFYRARGLGRISDVYLREARAGYSRWGATGKVRQLEAQHPQLRQKPGLAPTLTTSLGAADIDLLSVIKASQVVSGETDLGELLRKLVHVVLAQAGAEKGYVLLRRTGAPALDETGESSEALLDGLIIEAEARLDGDGAVAVNLLGSSVAASSRPLPGAVVNYVVRTKETVLLENATETAKFAADEYIARERTKSILCLPILRQRDLVGLFYLENAQVAGAFRRDQLQLLELLASQAAISIENARLLSQERAARTVAEEAQRRSTILAEVSGRFVEAASDEATFTRIARLLVPGLGRWCVIHLIRDGEFQVVAAVHADPAQQTPLRAQAEASRPDRRSGDPVAQLLAGAGPSSGGAPGTAELQEVGLAVPIVVRGRILGTISLGQVRPAPHAEADAALVVEIARRSALALDNAQRDEFLSVASHELNNPLGGLLVSLQELGDPAVVENVVRAEKYRRVALRLGKRLGRLIRDLHDLARIERGKLSLEPQQVDLCAMVEEVVEGHRAELTRKGCQLTVQACGGPVVGTWDAARLEQVLLNLLTNAAKFGAGEPIEVEVGQEGDLARVVVTDHGEGIVPAEQAGIFERHEHGREHGGATGGHAGLGLGLYICRRIIDAHQGTIQVQSEPGRGARFTIELPCTALASPAESPPRG